LEASISLELEELRRAFGFGPPAPIGSRDGESNEREADLAFIPTPSQGFGGADITKTLIVRATYKGYVAIFFDPKWRRFTSTQALKLGVKVQLMYNNHAMKLK